MVKGTPRVCNTPHTLAWRALMAQIIDGKAVAQAVREEVRDEVAAWVAAGNEPPGLATVLVGDDPVEAANPRDRRVRHSLIVVR